MVQRATSQPATGRVAFADCLLDPSARLLWRAGESVHVQPKVMELLLYLVQHRDRFVPKQELQQALWSDVVVGAASLPRLVKELRRALQDSAEQPRLVRTLHGRGYQFIGAAEGPSTGQPAATPAVPLVLEPTRSGSETGLGVVGWQLQLRTLHPPGFASVPLSRGTPLLVGRSADCALSLPFETVSRHHAELVLMGRSCTLRDMGSRNGVFVDGEKLLAPTVLRPGQVLRVEGWLGVLENNASSEAPSLPSDPDLSVGPCLAALLAPLLAVERSEALLLEGETGTGKSVLARALHRWSRPRGRLVVVDCGPFAAGAAVPDRERLTGAFEAARGGTLVLEDVDELSPALQDSLLTQLIAEASRAGAPGTRVRLVATAQSACHGRVLAGEFRAELFARLRALRLPPLRERACDVPGLLRHTLQIHSGGPAPELSARLVEALCLYDWPFNARELQLVVRTMLWANPGAQRLSRRHLPPLLAGQAPGGGHEFLVSALSDALRESEGDLERAAARTGVSNPDARRLLSQLRPPSQRESSRVLGG